MAKENEGSAPGLSEWMKVVTVGQLTRDAVLKTRTELEADRKDADKVEALRQRRVSGAAANGS